MKILSFGEIVWDEYADKRCIGGAPLNFAAHAARCGAKAFLLSAVGDDENGKNTRRVLRKFAVDDRYVGEIVGERTGRCDVTLDQNGVPSYDLLENCAYDKIDFFEELKSESFDAFAYGTLALRSEFNRQTLLKIFQSGICGKKYCDLNLRAPFYNKETVRFCLENADIVKLSEDELIYAADAFVSERDKSTEGKMRSIAERFKNLQTVVATFGEKGSAAYERKTRSFTYCAAQKTKIVSTVGAGDSFGAAFLCAYLRGTGIEDCLKEGAKRSAFVVSHAEAVPEE